MAQQQMTPAIKPFIHLYKNSDIPEESDDMEDYSKDVITVDSNGMMCIAYYHFEDKKWYFHSDTLYEGYENDFTWMYRPDGFKNWK